MMMMMTVMMMILTASGTVTALLKWDPVEQLPPKNNLAPCEHKLSEHQESHWIGGQCSLLGLPSYFLEMLAIVHLTPDKALKSTMARGANPSFMPTDCFPHYFYVLTPEGACHSCSWSLENMTLGCPQQVPITNTLPWSVVQKT